jgi:diguanylate cyclase (GGDEF)-like protein
MSIASPRTASPRTASPRIDAALRLLNAEPSSGVHPSFALRALDALPASVALIAKDGTIEFVNSAWQLTYRHDTDAAHACGVGANYLHAAMADRSIAHGILDVIHGRRQTFSAEYPCHSPTEQRWFLLQCTPTDDRQHAVVAHVDITSQKLAEFAVSELATLDPLTGLLNRRGVELELANDVSRLRETQQSSSVLLIDCDDFKQVNTTLGHTGGDAVLSAVGRRISSVLRPSDTLARIGGDEFLVLLPDTTTGVAGQIAEHIRLAVSGTPIAFSQQYLQQTISVATTDYSASVSGLDELLERCRFPLETAKAQGKNRTVGTKHAGVVSGRRSSHVTQRELLSAILDSCGSCATVIQPIVTPIDRLVVGYEVLSRPPIGAETTITSLFRLSQEHGMLGVLDNHCFRNAVARVARFDPRFHGHVNLYPSTLLGFSEGMIEELGETLQRGQLCIELSEQQILSEPRDLLPLVHQLRAAGIRIGLDDVGFGHTALETLIVLEPEVVKIDRSAVSGIAVDADRRRCLQRLVSVARALNGDVVAEGIETEADAAVLIDLGIDFAQGFLYGRPA